ncbi:MAG: segregation/condensation protein A [Patescibacteria group bacterium]
METAYKVKTRVFEGPFGLLLDLVEKRKLFINDVSLAEVTEDYLAYVKTAPPAEISSFIVVAATLILIKSKSLLPSLDLSSEEEGDIRSLEERLRLYELFRRLSAGVKKRFGQDMIFHAEERKNEMVVFLPDEQITRERMMELARGVIGAMPKVTALPEVPVKKIVTIEEMIKRLTERIEKSIKVSFRDFTRGGKGKEGKISTIVGFLAMLELVRQGLLRAEQEGNFEEIMIEKA